MAAGLALLGAGAALGRPRGGRAAGSDVLRIGNQKGGLRSLIEASGVGEDLPYRIEWSEFPAAAPLLEALNAGALDLGYQGDLAFLTSYASGAPVRAIGAGQSSPKDQAILVAGDGPIRSVADLRGRKVAGNRGGWGQFLIRAAIERAGLSPADVDLVLLPPVDAMLAFRSGAVDAWAIWEPYVSLEVLGSGARVVTDGESLTPSVVFVSAHQDAIRDKRAALSDFLRRFAAGWDWAANNRAAYAHYNAGLTHLPEAALLRAYETDDTRAAKLDERLIASVETAARRMTAYGLLRPGVEVRAALDLSFG
jgi:sulfonate transport system substrate-binding protein